MNVKILFIDVDGTLTDGKLYIGANGEICKAFNIKDGYGIHDVLIPSGIVPVVITGRTSEIVTRRCEELGISEVHQDVHGKVAKVKEILKCKGFLLQEAAYIGDDMNDIQSMQLILEGGGVVGCPFDAYDKVKEISSFVAAHNGGEGAVRDFIEWLIERNMKKDSEWSN